MEAGQIRQDECAQILFILKEAKYSTALSPRERKASRLVSGICSSRFQTIWGYDDVYFLGDAAYNGKENCRAIKASGRIPIMTPKKGQSPKGFNTWSDMLRFLEERPRTYHDMLHQHNIENTFSSLKARFGTMVSTKNLKTQWVWPSASTPFTSMEDGGALWERLRTS